MFNGIGKYISNVFTETTTSTTRSNAVCINNWSELKNDTRAVLLIRLLCIFGGIDNFNHLIEYSHKLSRDGADLNFRFNGGDINVNHFANGNEELYDFFKQAENEHIFDKYGIINPTLIFHEHITKILLSANPGPKIENSANIDSNFLIKEFGEDFLKIETLVGIIKDILPKTAEKLYISIWKELKINKQFKNMCIILYQSKRHTNIQKLVNGSDLETYEEPWSLNLLIKVCPEFFDKKNLGKDVYYLKQYIVGAVNCYFAADIDETLDSKFFNGMCSILDGQQYMLDLSGLDLSALNLGGAKFYGTDLRETILSGAELKGADLFNCMISYGTMLDNITVDKAFYTTIVKWYGRDVSIGYCIALKKFVKSCMLLLASLPKEIIFIIGFYLVSLESIYQQIAGGKIKKHIERST